jgi:hypothetical protein
MKQVGNFYGYLEYITAVWYMFWPFGNLVSIWYISPRFGILNKEKSGNPVSDVRLYFSETCELLRINSRRRI